jgi:predicted membrane protein
VGSIAGGVGMRVNLYATISRRLLLALSILMAIFCIAMLAPFAFSGRAFDFPIVLAAGVIGGFVSLQRRLRT